MSDVTAAGPRAALSAERDRVTNELETIGIDSGTNDSGFADSGQVTLSATITAIESQTISAYFQQHQASYAGMKPLPPGIAKKIARGGTLPPGIAKRYFPNDLIAQLPPRPGQQWVIVGTDVLLIHAGTSLILDLLARVF